MGWMTWRREAVLILYALPLTSHIYPQLTPSKHGIKQETKLIPKAANPTVGLPNWGLYKPIAELHRVPRG